jgi:alpha-tubulin suppressor-like RCC1 family protein
MITGVSGIASGYLHSLAVKSDGTVWAWGDDTDGELGNGTSGTTSGVPIEVGAGGSLGQRDSVVLGRQR